MKFTLPTKRINKFIDIVKFLENNNTNFELTIKKMYIEDLKSYRYIENILNINNRSVKKLLEHYNIPIRLGSDAVKTQWVNNDERRKDIGVSFAKSSKGNVRCRLQDTTISSRLQLGNFKLLNKEILNGKQYFQVECKYCNNVLRLDTSGLNKPHCKSKEDIKLISKGEKYILNYLKENNIEYKKEYFFTNLKMIKPLRFDFAIFDGDNLLCLVEFNGIQHYSINSRFSSDKVFKSDRMKKEYCELNNIKLITIPFYLINRVGEILDYHITQ